MGSIFYMLAVISSQWPNLRALIMQQDEPKNELVWQHIIPAVDALDHMGAVVRLQVLDYLILKSTPFRQPIALFKMNEFAL
jgi:hypothetical protein